jgi:hypothetical protein
MRQSRARAAVRLHNKLHCPPSAQDAHQWRALVNTAVHVLVGERLLASGYGMLCSVKGSGFGLI